MSKLLQKAAQEKHDIHDTDEFVTGEKTYLKKKSSSKRSGKTKAADIALSHIVYVGHIPHGFYEKEMRGFFRQFGEVKRLKLFRSAKTNNAKGYAFVELESEEVASVVAQATNGYFLHDKQLVANVVPLEKVHDGMFLPPKKRVMEEDSERPVMEADERNQLKAKKIYESISKKKQKLLDMDMKYNIPLPVPSDL
jgi:nucleolar protein 15